MKKYKHKPSDRILEVQKLGHNKVQGFKWGDWEIPLWVVNNSSDWEEIIEKDYEILSFKRVSDNEIWKKRDNKCFRPDKYSLGLSEDIMMYKGDSVKNGAFVIHSIKRLSDGEVFELGDKINHWYLNKYSEKIYQTYIIEKIYFIEKDRLAFYVGMGLNLGIKNIEKTKKALFTTEDGVDIYEGDEIWGIEVKNWKPFYQYAKCNPLNKAVTENWKHGKFSSKEKAEEYILWNKPVLSLQDLNESARVSISSIEHFTEIVKSRI